MIATSVVGKIIVWAPNVTMLDSEFNAQLLYYLPDSEYSAFYACFSKEMGIEHNLRKMVAKVNARYSYLQSNKRNSRDGGGAPLTDSDGR